MKKYIAFLCFGTLAFFSCSDLEEKPTGIIRPENFFNNTDDLQAAVNGAFANIAHNNYWGREFTIALMLRDDMADIGDRTTQAARIDVNDMNMNDTNALVANFWPQSYVIITAANQAIEGAKKTPGDPAKVNAIVAQAYFARAFTYYHLVRLFGDIPYIDFVVNDVSQVNSLKRTKEAEVYPKIIADLEFAKQWLDDKPKVKAVPGKGTAAGYLASVYLTLGQYQKAYDEAKYVITNEAKFGLGLDADFQDLFNATKAASLKEPLFTIDFNNLTSGNYGQDYTAFFTGSLKDDSYSYGQGFSVAVPSLKVFNTWDQRDYRRAVSFDTIIRKKTGPGGSLQVYPSSDNEKAPRPHIAKYFRFPGKAGANGRTSQHNYITMRYAEVLLTAAEALNEINPGTTEADGYVNRVRARARNKAGKQVSFPANVTPGLSKADFKKMVIDERRLELAFEYIRWYDIKRLKNGPEVFGPNGLEPHANFNPEKDYLWPLPGTELAINPNLKPNNPGY
ncbi:RagB/SusD family nutrient uptake outer membrane protein [Flavobacterium sp.]|uniref:RagB/SusD family nutrient uptake outer membrane protein n=1 Tax=Flavobacterium sp. TaxID=239 RepID=UPI0031D9E063